MRKLMLCLLFFLGLTVSSSAGIWEDKCADCHGLIAPSKEQLLNKFKTPEELALKAKELSDKKIMPRFDFDLAAKELFDEVSENISPASLNGTQNLNFSLLPSYPPIPSDNSQTTAKVILGKMLYFESRLSRSNTISCNTCHNIASGGDDNHQVAIGYGWRKDIRNTPTVFNVGYLKVFGWTGKATSLEDMVKMNIQDPVKMNGVEDRIVGKIKSVPEYISLFRKAFPDEGDPINLENISKAIAAYLRTLNTFGSKFDRFLSGDTLALSDEAKIGMNLFIEKGCVKCHYGAMLTDEKFHKFTIDNDPGRFEVTGNETDKGFFRTAPLKNVALTAPYFHNGSVLRLDLAVKIMADRMLNEELSDVEAWRIKVFLETLTAFPSVDARVMPVLPQQDD
ncbi:cytochrome-c peroxidase [Desulfurobacterium atlanticum]|uniref:Cytochrome c peroxidase n=1 Tax=Desulfurobacterium atlanticum TaxID=240169 RepID=A0A238Z4P3_9BACT|nr:cytochrome c peroxidase [Desulfurobacterium atlanticum]SNR78395.1 cytochrome c peroxidase [Desulfurobacterium atlanticum]